MEKGGEIRGAKRRVRLRVGVGEWGELYWQFQVRDEEECSDGHIQSRERKEVAAMETTSKSNI